MMFMRTFIYYCLIFLLLPFGLGLCGVTYAQEVTPPPHSLAVKSGKSQDVVFLPKNNPPPIRIDASLEKTSVPYDQDIVFNVAVSWLGEGDMYSLGFPATPRLHNLKMVASSSENLSESSDIGVKYIKRFIYRFRARHEEPAEIGQVIVEYKDNTTHKKLTVTTQAVSVTILPPEKDLYKKLFKWASAISAFLFLTILIYVVVIKFKRKKQEKDEPVPQTIEELITEEFKKMDIMSADVKEYYSGISRLLKRYLSDKYAVKTVEETTEKIDARLLDIGFPEEQKRKVDKILSICDSVKFAQYTPSSGEMEKVKTYFEEILKASIEITGQVKQQNENTVYSTYYHD